MKIDTPQKREAIDKIVRENAGSASRAIARLLYAKFPQLFATVESARCAVRTRRGAHGAQNRQSMRSRKAEFQEPKQAGKVFNIPPSIAKPGVPYEVRPGKVAILCDVHIPYHDTAALKAALAHLDGEKPTTILLGGDVIDFFSISRYEKDPSQRDLVGEIEATKQFLEHLRGRYPKAKIVYKVGNHDERWRHYIWQKAPELWALPQMKLEAILELERLEIDIVDDRRAVNIGKLTFLHGHELEQGAASPVNPARGVFLRTLESFCIGHRHRSSDHAEKTALDRFVTCWSIGALCDLKPEYAPVNKWNHGFAMVDLKKDGSFHFRNYRIHKGKVL